jgi:hypothetical protein
MLNKNGVCIYNTVFVKFAYKRMYIQKFVCKSEININEIMYENLYKSFYYKLLLKMQQIYFVFTYSALK